MLSHVPGLQTYNSKQPFSLVNGVAVQIYRQALQFSFFLKDFQIIKLDNRDEAMVGENNLCVSENYILVYGSVYELHPCRLFTKKGEFVTNIGAIGQGPGEYRAVYKAEIDEKHNCIYLMPFDNSNAI